MPRRCVCQVREVAALRFVCPLERCSQESQSGRAAAPSSAGASSREGNLALPGACLRDASAYEIIKPVSLIIYYMNSKLRNSLSAISETAL